MTQETSKLAYFTEVLPTLSDRHKRVLGALGEVWDATNMELAERLDWSINRITPRCLELRLKGLVEKAGQRQCRITGRTAICWRLKGKEKRLF